MQAGELTCEYRKEPLGIDVAAPRFTWQLTDKQNTRGQKQTAYHVLVASSRAALDQDQGDLWDSEVVKSNQSALVVYAGKSLPSNQSCYWKVRSYDKDNEPTTWSAVSHFTTGLFSAADWKGQWIKHPDTSLDRHIWFRKSFSLDAPVTTAMVYVASAGYHELYVNGTKADSRVLSPSLTRIDKRVLYVTYDVASLMKRGKNTIALWYGAGWARSEAFRQKVTPAIRVQLNARTQGGKDVVLCSDSTWKSAFSSSQYIGGAGLGDYGGELIDERAYLPEWNKNTFKDDDWKSCMIVQSAVALSSQTMEPTRIINTLQAKSISDTTKGYYRIDMGKNFTGWIYLSLPQMAAGDTVAIKVADNSGTLQSFGQKNLYICSGKKGEAFCNRFNFMAGRYISIQGLKQRPRLNDIKGYVVATDLERTGYFTSSNDLFNRIYETDLWTYRANTIEGYTADCPHRERLGYGEECFATAWGIGMPNYKAGAFYAKNIRDWIDVQESNGWINYTSPQVTGNWGGPMWSSAGINIAWAHYQTYGDLRILDSVYAAAKKWLRFLNRFVSDGILQPFALREYFLGDWMTPEGAQEKGDTREALFFNNCVYAMNLETVSQMAEALGQTREAEAYNASLTALKKSIHRQFYNAQTGTYSNGLQVPLAFALWQKIVPDSLCGRVLKQFAHQFTKGQPYMGYGSSGLPVVLNFLIEHREFAETAAAHLSSTDKPGYGSFLQQGETTWPESWGRNAESKIHTCYTGIASWFVQCLAGIRPDPERPGYQSFLLQPTPVANLTYAAAQTETLYGIIKSSWRKEGAKLIFNVSVPVNTEARFYIPFPEPSQITEGGKPLQRVKGAEVAGVDKAFTILKLGAGNYQFVYTLKTK